MEQGIYERDGHRYLPTEWAGSPWSTGSQHGGPVNALLVRAAEAASRETGLRVARVTVDLLGPVPMQPLRLGWRYLRRGRRMATVEAELAGQGRVAARATAVLLAAQPGQEPSWPDADPAPAGPDAIEPVPFMHRAYRELAPPGFHHSLQIRMLEDEPSVWITTPLDLVAGERITALERAAAVSDLAFGVSGRLLLRQRRVDVEAPRIHLINTDTSLYFERAPVGEWLCFRRAALSDRDGTGLVEVVQYDRRGRYGRALQLLLATSPPG